MSAICAPTPLPSAILSISKAVRKRCHHRSISVPQQPMTAMAGKLLGTTPAEAVLQSRIPFAKIVI